MKYKIPINVWWQTQRKFDSSKLAQNIASINQSWHAYDNFKQKKTIISSKTTQKSTSPHKIKRKIVTRNAGHRQLRTPRLVQQQFSARSRQRTNTFSKRLFFFPKHHRNETKRG